MSNFGIAVKSYDGNYAGILKYEFDSSKGVCAVENRQGYDIFGASSVGMWIFGDNSRNELDFVFGSSPEKLVPIDTIDWYGYKYIGMWRDNSDASTDVFKGFAIRHLQTSLFDSGGIYVDDIQVNGNVTGLHHDTMMHPASFGLFQNYPNPFNPKTVIDYQIPIAGNVTLKIYDVLGREVATLVDGRQNAGNYAVSFDAGNLPSGIYFYRIIAGSFSSVRKLSVVK